MLAASLVALASAGGYAIASVLQQRAASAEPAETSMRVGLLWRLVQRPIWLAGVAADISGYVLQFIALGIGSLAVVQPLLVSGLLLALPFSAALERRHLQQREWLAAGAVVAGLALFLVVANPAAGRDDASGKVWLIVTLATLGPAAVSVAAAATSNRAIARAQAMALAAGLSYGYTAALTKTSAHLLSLGLGTLLSAWQPYALAAVAAGGMLLSQSAFQAAPLDASLPTLTVVDPVVSVLIGAFGFHESIRAAPWAIGLDFAALALVTWGISGLGRVIRDNAHDVTHP